MKIGLVRHFKVKQAYPGKVWLTKPEVIKWFDDYDLAEVECREANFLEAGWKVCYTSPLKRAVKTAGRIYHGPTEKVDALKELDVLYLLPAGIKLPFLVWGLLVRIKFLASNKDTHEFRLGIKLFLDNLVLENEAEVLIVSHWFVMKILQEELVKRGFAGHNFRSPGYGTLYVFEKKYE